MKLRILYRGHLSDCNYSCYYCPFRKNVNTPEEIEKDRIDLFRFVQWVKEVSSENFTLEILFTPFGEALVREWYQRALVELSNLPFVTKVAVQTNLSAEMEWLCDCGNTLAIWATYHPDMVDVDEFAARSEWMRQRGIRHSVGTVGIREQFEKIETIRNLLNPEIYLWVNAYKHEKNYYSKSDIETLSAVDPYFYHNLGEYFTEGMLCRTGATVVSVEGNGDLYRCNFIKEKRGNIFMEKIEDLLWDSPCSREECHCHIGYIHLETEPFYEIYGSGVLERIPENWRYDAQ